jgi:hypothetical protein
MLLCNIAHKPAALRGGAYQMLFGFQAGLG